MSRYSGIFGWATVFATFQKMGKKVCNRLVTLKGYVGALALLI
jgi:hypothetical protein